MMTIYDIHARYRIPIPTIQAILPLSRSLKRDGNKMLYRESEIISLVQDEYQKWAEYYADKARKMSELVMEVED